MADDDKISETILLAERNGWFDRMQWINMYNEFPEDMLSDPMIANSSLDKLTDFIAEMNRRIIIKCKGVSLGTFAERYQSILVAYLGEFLKATDDRRTRNKLDKVISNLCVKLESESLERGKSAYRSD